MPSKHDPGNKVLGWRNPSAELAAWVRAEAKRAGTTISALLTEAVTDLRAKRARERDERARAKAAPSGGEEN